MGCSMRKGKLGAKRDSKVDSSDLTSKGPVLQYPNKVSRAGLVELTRVRGESRAPEKTEVMRDVPGQAGKSSQQVRIRSSDSNQDQPHCSDPQASLWITGRSSLSNASQESKCPGQGLDQQGP